MKRVLCFFVLISVVSSGFAETWNDYINRTHELTTKAQEYLRRSNYRTWSNDIWGALAAIYDWTSSAYEDIYKNAPDLSDYERRIYRDMSIRAYGQFEDIIRLSEIHFNGFRQWDYYIEPRYNIWFDHFNRGGTITFN